MTNHERIKLVEAIDKSGLADLSGFKVESFHGLPGYENEGRDYWDIILTPLIKRIYFVSELFYLTKQLGIDVAVFTDIDRAGCILFH